MVHVYVFVKVRQRRDFSVFKSTCHLLLYYLSSHSKVEAIPLSPLPKGHNSELARFTITLKLSIKH